MASPEVDQIIAAFPDWRGDTLSRIRGLIVETLAGVIEEAKWKKPTNPLGVATWSLGGVICTGETYKDKVKLTFPKGSSIDDPTGLLAVGAGVRRAIDIREGEMPDADALQAVIRAAAALNAAPKG
ncbi:DUF1801 domain-containing protein [Agreia sp. Leaf210]|uniref:DUF1801 domain-containing protein n=1 Tax=Agreia sp. Leaf210 TaxID=1735682 RepID=UPI000701AE1C|nr:DUF1801 domain-containing protein [Agreia sp. Leaf210]KQM57532.1 hypothetical protein ASE64_15345 [Agreia sp. Leaf210]